MIDVNSSKIPYMSRGEKRGEPSSVESVQSAPTNTGTISEAVDLATDVAEIGNKVTGFGRDLPTGTLGTGLGVLDDIAAGKGIGQTGINAATNMRDTLGMQKLGEAIGPAAGPVGTGIMGAARGLNPEAIGATMTASALNTVASMLGYAIDPIAGLVAGQLVGRIAYDSVNKGVIGDVWDARSYEGVRDSAETQGADYNRSNMYAEVVGDNHIGDDEVGPMEEMSQMEMNSGKSTLEETEEQLGNIDYSDMPDIGGNEGNGGGSSTEGSDTNDHGGIGGR